MAMRTPATWLCCLAFAASSGAAEKRACTRQEAIRAEVSASAVKSWSGVRSSFSQYGHCDDGAIAEGYSAAVVALLADRWGDITVLQEMVSRDSAFGQFVIRHIDDTAEAAAFQRLKINAAKRWPTKAAGVCSMILSRVRELERE
jgi:hypothetical protein